MSRKTIQEFEVGLRRPFARTLDDLQRTFEAAGIEFIEPVEEVKGRGVILKWGVDVPSYETWLYRGPAATPSEKRQSAEHYFLLSRYARI